MEMMAITIGHLSFSIERGFKLLLIRGESKADLEIFHDSKYFLHL